MATNTNGGLFTVKQNDTGRALVFSSTTGTQAFDLTASYITSLTPKMRVQGGAVKALTATVTGAANGEITVNWAGTDLDTVGVFELEVEVQFNGTAPGLLANKLVTFPQDGYINVRVIDDI